MPEVRGFTLVELLVVLSVVAILSTLLVPAVGSSLRSGKSSQCRSNLHQWGVALSLYADDHESLLPRRGQGIQPVTVINRPEDWFNALPRYLQLPAYEAEAALGRYNKAGARNLFVCPTATNNPSGPHFFSYAMNMQLSPWNAARPQRMSEIASAERVVFLADAPGPYASTVPAAAPHCVASRHDGKANIVFLDGHVRDFESGYLGCDRGDPDREDVWWQPVR